MDLNKINVLNHEISNFKHSIDRLKRELDDIENGDKYEYNQWCETINMDLRPNIGDIEYLHKEMKKLEESGIDGLYIEFEECIDEDYDGCETYYTNVSIYGDKKYAQEKLNKRKVEIESEIENYNKRIEEYKEKLKLEVLREG
jgi:chromosome segregation ATPase